MTTKFAQTLPFSRSLGALLACAVLAACAVDADTSPDQVQAIIGPELEARPGMLEFGSVAVGSKVTRTVTLTNVGDVSIQCNGIIPSDPALVVSAGWIQHLDPGESHTVMVTYAPRKPGALSATLDVTDGESSIYSLPVSGTAK